MKRDLKFVWGIIIAIFLIPTFVFATHVSYEWEIDGSGYIETYFENPNLVHEMITEIDGVAYVQMTLLDETDELAQLKNYVTGSEEGWNDNGISMGELEELIEKMEKYRNGEKVELTKREYSILMSLLGIIDAEIGDFYDLNIGPVFESHYNQILSNLYEIEALYRTLEKVYPDIYCESRQEVMTKYGLKSVVCGLHSKRCYNGKFYSHENGLNYCIYTDEGHSEDGMNIHLKNIKVYESDQNSLTPIEITLFNQGEKTMKPILKVDIKKLEKTLGHFEYEMEEVEGEKTYVVAWDNSGLEAGEYTLRATVYLDKKEILEDVDFEILKEGSLAKEGEIVSLKLNNQPLAHYETVIETVIKNHGSIPTAFKVRGDVYRDGEKVDYIESQKILVNPGETEPFYMTYKIPDLGEYDVIVRSNHNMEEVIVFDAIPSTPTGRFMTSPSGGMFGLLTIIIIALYGTRFLYHKRNKMEYGKIELVKIPKNYRRLITKKTRKKKTGRKGTVKLARTNKTRKTRRKK